MWSSLTALVVHYTQRRADDLACVLRYSSEHINQSAARYPSLPHFHWSQPLYVYLSHTSTITHHSSSIPVDIVIDSCIFTYLRPIRSPPPNTRVVRCTGPVLIDSRTAVLPPPPHPHSTTALPPSCLPTHPLPHPTNKCMHFQSTTAVCLGSMTSWVVFPPLMTSDTSLTVHFLFAQLTILQGVHVSRLASVSLLICPLCFGLTTLLPRSLFLFPSALFWRTCSVVESPKSTFKQQHIQPSQVIIA